MYSINNKAFSYLLYAKKHTGENAQDVFNNPVDMIYYYLNRGVPMSDDMPEPIYCTQEMVNQYGLDNLVMNMQRKYKYDYDIIVVKVPQEYLRMDFFSDDVLTDEEHSREYYPKMLPMICSYDINGKKRNIIAADYIESVYLRYPDCRRVINDNWCVVSPNTLGLKNSDLQNSMLEISRHDMYPNISQGEKQLLDVDKFRNAVMDRYNLSTNQLIDASQDDRQKRELGYSQSTVDFIKKKYQFDEKIFRCAMSRSRIENILAVETERQSKKDRCRFVGE